MTDGASLEAARAAKSQALRAFSELLGEEVSVGLAPIDGEGFALKINLTRAPDPELSLPREISGVPIQVEVIGEIRKR